MNCRWMLGLVAACSGPSTDSPRRGPGPAVAVLPEVPFVELDRDQRIELMKTHVMPTMTPLFQRHEPQKFAVVDCKTCHAETGWQMPNAELPHLDLADLAEFDRRDIDWMTNEIVPAMRRVLRDPEVKCGRCHPLRAF